jgi:hypothetical protein
MLGVTSSGIWPVFFAHSVIGLVHDDKPAQAAMSLPPITPGSLRSSCHSGEPLAKSPNQVASSNSFISLGSFDTGKVFPSLSSCPATHANSLGVGLPFVVVLL